MLGPPLRRVLENAVIVASDAVPPEVVTMHSEVLLSDDQPERSLRAHVVVRS